MTSDNRPGHIELSVIAPCLNEAGNLPEFVSRMLRVFAIKDIQGEIILIDDGSTDATAAVIREKMAEHPGRITGVFHESNKGLEQGWSSGLHASKGTYVCLIDADLQNQPEDVYSLLREIRFSNVDLVQGTRSHIGRLKDARYILSVGLNTLLNIGFGMRARDNKSGFVLCRREVLEEILRHRYNYTYFQTFITVAAHARGYSIREVETLFESRAQGESFISKFPVGLITRALIDIGKALKEYRFNRYQDRLVEDFVKSNPPLSAPSPPLQGLRRAYFQLYMLLMPLHHWMITRDAGYYYSVLERSQWLSPAALEELQSAKLRRLIAHAYWHVPFYRESMDRMNLRPEDLHSLDDLPKLPYLEKEDVRNNLYFDLISDSHRKKDIYRISTSGSTGQPLLVWVDRHQLEFRWAATYRSQEWTGYRFGDRAVRLWHQTIGMDRLQVIKERLDAWLCRRKFVPAFEMSASGVKQMESVIRSHRPTLVDGYAESFHHLARHGIDPSIRKLPIRGLMSSAQTLDNKSRGIIEEAFGTKVFDKYGSREFSGIAYECEHHSGHHVVAEGYIVEILVDGRPARPGELGEVVITDLNNFVMPLIRYRIGDLAYAEDNSGVCPCGRGLPRIGAVEGRVKSIVLGANGVAMPGSFFLHLLKDFGNEISKFQIEQKKPGEIIFRYIPGPRFAPDVLSRVFDEFRRYLGDGFGIGAEAVDNIKMVRTGKHQVVINRLSIDYQSIDKVLDPREAQ